MKKNASKPVKKTAKKPNSLKIAHGLIVPAKTSPASDREESHLKRWLKERRITEVECLVPDITGNARGKIIPGRQVLHRLRHAPARGYLRHHRHRRIPRRLRRTRQRLGLRHVPASRRRHRAHGALGQRSDRADHPRLLHQDGEPHELAPRNVLRRVLARYEALGLKPIIAPELEFFLVQKNTDPDFPLQPPVGRNGRPETARQSYSIDAVNEFDPILDLMYDYCESMELDVDTLIHESGAAQLEINFQHADPLSRADQVFLFKRTMREAALRHDIYATFLAKPMENEPGSSMHIHQSIVDAKTGKNVFIGKDGARHSQLFMNYLGGLQKLHSGGDGVLRAERQLLPPPGLSAKCRRRTCSGATTTAPAACACRSTARKTRAWKAVSPVPTPIRTWPSPRHWPAVCWASRKSCSPPKPSTGYTHSSGFELPKSMQDSLEFLERSEALGGILGERFCRAYVCIKRKEYETFFRVISSWEREFLLLNV